MADDQDKKNADELVPEVDAPKAEAVEAETPDADVPEAATDEAAPEADDTKADEVKAKAKTTDDNEAEADEAPEDDAPEDDATDAEPGSEADAKAAKKPSRRRSRSRSGQQKTAPAPKPRKPAEPILGPDGQPILVKATSKYVRSSSRKARIVIDNIRGQSVPQARVTLAFTQRRVANDVAKVLESAVANAEHNHELDADDLHVAAAFADEGPVFKRWQPRARGRATPINKRTTHITVVVSPTPASELEKHRKAAA